MTRFYTLALLLAVVATPAMAQTATVSGPAATSATISATAPTVAPAATAVALPTVTKEAPSAAGLVTTATTPVAVSGGVGPGGAVVTTETTITPSATVTAAMPTPPAGAEAVATPILGAGSSPSGQPTAADLLNAAPVAQQPAPTMATQTMPVTQAPVDNSGNPLCATVHTPAANVTAGQPVAVSTPKMIPLSVNLAKALGIQGFENIVSEGPIGFVTVNDQGKVFFEGQDLSTNVANMCASGNVPAVGTASASAAPVIGSAPDGAAYAAGLPGQSGYRMQPIVDGPSYKTPPKRKKAAPKKAEVKKEELAPVASEPKAATPSTTSGSAPADDNLGSMMRTAPATTETVPMAPKPAETTTNTAAFPASEDDSTATTAVLPAEDAALPSSSGAAVSEVLRTDDFSGSQSATDVAPGTPAVSR